MVWKFNFQSISAIQMNFDIRNHYFQYAAIDNVNGGMISGLKKDELDFITNMSNESQNEGDLLDQ